MLKLTLIYQAVFLFDQKNKDRNLNILRTERAFKVKLKAFFIIFKGLSVSQKLFQTWEWTLKNHTLRVQFSEQFSIEYQWALASVITINIATFVWTEFNMPEENSFSFLKTVFNPFHATGLFLNPLKTEKFSGGIKRDKWN